MERFRKRFILIASALVITQAGGTLGFILIDTQAMRGPPGTG